MTEKKEKMTMRQTKLFGRGRYAIKIALVMLLILSFMSMFAACGSEGLTLKFMVDDVLYKTVNTTGALEIPTDPEKEGYVFAGWYDGETKVTEISAGRTGEVILRAKWTPVKYSITYANPKSAVNANPADYTIESDSITLADLELTGYTFAGWFDGETRVTEIPKGSQGDRALTAKWIPVDYSIVYKDSKNADNANPTEYTVESEDIVLAELSSNGYTFTGWYEGETKVTVIHESSTGDKELTARWEVTEYPLTYLNTMGVTNDNPASYTIESDTITFADLSAEGFTFEGWYDGETKITEIAAGSYGERMLLAKWTPLYTVKFYVDGQELTMQGDDPIVPNKNGYAGDWGRYEINDGVISIHAVYKPIEYTVTYENTQGASNVNVDKYTIETDTFTLMPLERENYVFEGWYDGSAKVAQITKGSYGNKTLMAKWTSLYTRIDASGNESETGDYLLFGKYPQTLKSPAVEIVSEVAGNDGYWLGSDGESYAKVTAVQTANDRDYKYYEFSDKSLIAKGETYYFKVEPLKWRILKTGNGKSLIVSDSIIANKSFKSEEGINANDYSLSSVRTWLNDSFYSNAFHTLQQQLINVTNIDTMDESVEDRVFLLSFEDAVSAEYGFIATDSVEDVQRSKTVSDYARATGAYMNTTHEKLGQGWWWLRSPSDESDSYAMYVASDGTMSAAGVESEQYGVAPALWITL